MTGAPDDAVASRVLRVQRIEAENAAGDESEQLFCFGRRPARVPGPGSVHGGESQAADNSAQFVQLGLVDLRERRKRWNG